MGGSLCSTVNGVVGTSSGRGTTLSVRGVAHLLGDASALQSGTTEMVRLVNLKEIKQLLGELDAQGTLFMTSTTAGMMKTIDKIWDLLNRWVDEYPAVVDFQADWVRARLFVPLQIRLAMEQLLWERGGGYRSLVTGFGPATVPGGAVGRSRTPTRGVARGGAVSDARDRASVEVQMRRRQRADHIGR